MNDELKTITMKTKTTIIQLACISAISLATISCNKSDADQQLSADPASNKPASTAPAPLQEGWQTINTNIFQIQMPAGWEHQELTSIDTYNGKLTDGAESMNYEYGMMHDTFKIDPERFSFQYETIDGKRAKIIQGERFGIAIDQMSEDPAKQRRFILMQSSAQPMNKEMAMKMIRSIDFK